MRANKTKNLLKAGKPALGLFVSSGSQLTAEIVGGLGLDWVLIDLQHGENNLGNISGMLQAVSLGGSTPFVRVAANDSTLIQRSLDLGAYGIVVPLVNTPEQAEAAVQAAKYMPRGQRSWGPIRGSLYGGSDYFQHADQETSIIVMLETAEAAAHAGSILAIDGVDGCLVGPNDLAISFGFSPEGSTGETLPPPVESAIDSILAACAETGKSAGIQLYSVEAANHRICQGFRFVGLGTELRLMRGAIAATLGGVNR